MIVYEASLRFKISASAINSPTRSPSPTVKFATADLRITPFLHHMHSSQGTKLFAFVKRFVAGNSMHDTNITEISEQVTCFLVDQDTLKTVSDCMKRNDE